MQTGARCARCEQISRLPGEGVPIGNDNRGPAPPARVAAMAPDRGGATDGVEQFAPRTSRSAVLGFDGKWVLHPGQIDAANEIYAPSQEDYDHAELKLDAYDWFTSEAGAKKGSATR
jgi:hypothetical protein